MKVSFQLDNVDDSDLFTSADWLSGKVLLAIPRADAVTSVTVTLQGKLVSSVVAAATNPLDGELHAVDEHKLFKISETVFPLPNVPVPSKGFSLSKGVTTFPFKFRLPVLSTCQNPNPQDWIKHLKTTLPPSFKFQSTKNDGSATVHYYLRVKVLRPGRWKSNLVVTQSINFMPLDPALPPPMMEPTKIKSTRTLRFELPASPGVSSPSSPLVVDSRSVTVSASLPAPAVLRLGSGLPLGVSVVAKEGMTLTPSLFVRSLTINILTELTVNVGPNLRTWTTWKELTSTEIALELKPDEEQELSTDLWKHAILPKCLTPSFTTCTLMQQHFVVVLVGLSYGKEGSILNMKATMNVELHSGVRPRRSSPQLPTPEEESNEDDIAFVPWRMGSERHLGILGRRDSRTDNAPPPPY